MYKIMNGLIFLLHNFQCNARKYEIIKFSIHQFTKKTPENKKKRGINVFNRRLSKNNRKNCRSNWNSLPCERRKWD